jgi:hypothetical protein
LRKVLRGLRSPWLGVVTVPDPRTVRADSIDPISSLFISFSGSGSGWKPVTDNASTSKSNCMCSCIGAMSTSSHSKNSLHSAHSAHIGVAMPIIDNCHTVPSGIGLELCHCANPASCPSSCRCCFRLVVNDKGIIVTCIVMVSAR